MRRWILAGAMVVGAACATARPAGEAALNPSRASSPSEAWDQVDKDAAATVAAHHWPDLALGVVSKGKLVFFRGYGARDSAGHPVTENSVFRFGSITKSFTDLVILQLRDEGKLSIDDPVARYVPEINGVVYPTAEHPPITLRQLMHHSSGLPRLGSFDYTTHAPTEQEVLSSLQGMPLNATPGTASEYSNLALCLAGVVVQRVAGVPYHDAIRTRIFEPLGMQAVWAPEAVPPDSLADGHDDSGKAIPDWRMGVCDSAGGIYGSLDDLARWAELFLSAWPPRDAAEPKVASRATLREVQSGATPFLQPQAVSGMGWFPSKDPLLELLVGHNGGMAGYSAEIWMLPERDVAVVALVGVSSDEPALQHLAKQTLATALPFFPKPVPELSQWMKAKVAELFQSLEVGATPPAGLYSDAYLAAPKTPPAPKDTPEKETAWLRDYTGGACSVALPQDSKPFVATFRARCARGEFDLTLRLISTAPYAIRGFWIKGVK